jgi:branched-chain amino acid transport system ATP-binding protein
MTVIMQAEGLSKKFGDFLAVSGLNLTVQEGSIHGLIGPNGAGKTTSFNLLTKFLQPTTGTISFQGRDITRMGPAQVARMGLVRSFQISSVFPDLTVHENVRVALQRGRGENRDFWRSSRCLRVLDDEVLSLLDDVGLLDFAPEMAGTLSYGRKRALEIATTLALKPTMLMLDEPTAGMTAADVDRVVALIQRIRAHRTIMLIEHNLSVVRGLCDRITVLARGSTLVEGDYATVAANETVRAAYLGATHHA